MNLKICDKIVVNKTFTQISINGSNGLMSLMTKCLQNIIIKNNRNIYTENANQRQRYRSSDHNLGSNESMAKRRRFKTNYDILGINADSSHREIKSAYYSLSKTCHPDVNQSSEAEVQFREITDAYEVLANKESKKAYDLMIGNTNTFQKRPKKDTKSEENINTYNDWYKYHDLDANYEYRQKWRYRRTVRKENIYKEPEDPEKETKYGYKDPLRGDPEEFFAKHFTEEMQSKYAEQIRKHNEEFRKTLAESENETKIQMTLVFVIICLFIALHVICEEYLKLSEPTVKTNENNKNNANNGRNS